MTPKEQNILDTLHLLVLLFRARKQQIPKLSEEEQHTLRVLKEHLAGANLTIPVFANTLELLDRKGYLMAVSIFGQKGHDDIAQILDDKKYAEALALIEDPDAEVFKPEGKQKIAELIASKLPVNYSIDTKALAEEKISIREILDDTRNVLKGHTPEEVSVVILMPFRSIERLLDKMQDGMKFDEIQDAGVWYDARRYQFHFGDEVVDTARGANPNIEHFILMELFTPPKPVVDYMNVPEFSKDTPAKRNKRCSDALRSFVKKHSRLSEIFKVHSDRLEIKKEYLEHTH